MNLYRLLNPNIDIIAEFTQHDDKEAIKQAVMLVKCNPVRSGTFYVQKVEGRTVSKIAEIELETEVENDDETE